MSGPHGQSRERKQNLRPPPARGHGAAVGEHERGWGADRARGQALLSGSAGQRRSLPSPLSVTRRSDRGAGLVWCVLDPRLCSKHSQEVQPIPPSAQQIPLLSCRRERGAPSSGCSLMCTHPTACRTHGQRSNRSGFAVAELTRLQPIISLQIMKTNAEHVRLERVVLIWGH